jgi:hypothetical protein
MKTPFDASEILFNYLNVSELTSVISGSVYHHNERPIESINEDVVVGTLSMTDMNVQGAVLNINIYAKDIKNQSANKFYSNPDRVKLKTITAKVVEVLGGNKGKYWKDGELKVKMISGVIPEAEIKQHYVNIRVSMKLHANYN